MTHPDPIRHPLPSGPVPAIAPQRVEMLVAAVFRQIDRLEAGVPCPSLAARCARLIWPPDLGLALVAATLMGVVFGSWVAPTAATPQTATLFSTDDFLPIGS